MDKRLFHLRKLLVYSALGSIALLASCVAPSTPNPNATKPLKAVFINPYKAGSYDHFKAGPNYPKTSISFKNKEVLAATNASNSNIIIDLSLQRGFLMKNSVVAMDYPVSTGKKKYPTPEGNFRITEKIVDKRSNLYGRVLDANGKVVKYNADSREDKVPEGGSFLGASMRHWMRLTGDGIGMHRGRVPRYPASHGCIRTPGSIVPIVFKKVRVGTLVTIQR